MTIQEYNDIYKNTVIKKMTIATSGGLVIRNSNIASENMSLEESLCSEQNLKFGCCEASCFKVRLLECNHSFLGEWLDVTQTIYADEDGFLLLENGDYLLTEDGFRIQLESADAFSKYGRFKVYSDKPTNDRMWRDLVCYDVMYDILNADMLPWYKALTFPMTLKALRDSFFDYLQIPQQTTTLVNDNFQTEGGFLVDGQLSGKTIINAICELNGVFGHISHEGVFEYISLPSADTIALDWYYDGTGAYEGYVVDNITGIRAIGSDADAGTTVGTTDNVYIVNNNPLIYGTEGTPELETALTNLLNAIKDITYRPFNVTTYGNPMLPLGTNLVINTRDQVINSFVMSRKLNGIQTLKDTYKAVGEEKQPDDVNSLQSQIIRSRGKTHEMEVDVNQLKSTINDPETGVVSILEQTVERIVMKVDDNGKIVQVELGKDPDDESATRFKVDANNISFIADGKIELTSNSLEINSTNFKVDTAGNITCNGGTIGSLNITQDALYYGKSSMSSETENGIYICSQGISMGAMDKIQFLSNGYAYIWNFTLGDRLQYRVANTFPGYYGFDLLTHTYDFSTYNGYVSINAGKIQPDHPYQPYIEEAIRLVYLDTSNNGYGAYRGVLCGNWYAENLYGNIISSKHAKDNIKPITDEEAMKLLETNPVSFDLKSGRKDQRGLIAEEIEEIYPNLVNYPVGTTKETFKYNEEEPDKVIGLDYIGFIPYLIKMVQIQQKEIDELKARI